MSENDQGQPTFTKRKLLTRVMPGVAAAGFALAAGLRLHPTADTTPVKASETDPLLADLTALNEQILSFKDSSDPEELEKLYKMATDRRGKMSSAMQLSEQARDFILSETNTKAREKIETIIRANQVTFEQNIFKKPGQADKTGWLTEKVIAKPMVGKLVKMATDSFGSTPPAQVEPAVNHYTFYALGEDQPYSLFIPKPEQLNGDKVVVLQAIVLMQEILAAPHSVISQ